MEKYDFEMNRNEDGDRRWQLWQGDVPHTEEHMIAEFITEADMAAWVDNQTDPKASWKMPAWMVPYCNTQYLGSVERTIMMTNFDKGTDTHPQVSPVVAWAIRIGGEVGMLERLMASGALDAKAEADKSKAETSGVYIKHGQLIDSLDRWLTSLRFSLSCGDRTLNITEAVGKLSQMLVSYGGVHGPQR